MCTSCPPRKRHPLVRALLLAIIASALLIAIVFATGSTFGQRCAKVYQKGSTAWQACIVRLKDGGQP